MSNNRYDEYIRKTFWRYILGIISLLVILAAVVLFVNAKWTSEDKNKKYNREICEFLKSELNAYLEAVDKFAQDNAVTGFLKNESSESRAKVNMLLYDFVNIRKLQSHFMLLDENGDVKATNLYKGNKTLFEESTQTESLIQKLLKSPDERVMSVDSQTYASGQTGDLIFGRAVTETGEIKGFLFFDISDSSFYENLNAFPLDDIIITDRYDNLVFSMRRQSLDPLQKYPSGKYRFVGNNNDTVIINQKTYHVYRTQLEGEDLYVYTLLGLDLQKSLIRYMLVSLVLTGIFLMIFMKPVVASLVKSSRKSVDELQLAVSEMGKGNMDFEADPLMFQEYQTLLESFRNMVRQREELLRDNSELVERKRIMEIKQLEEKFNPHFVFNVLETLRYMIVIDQQIASEMVVAFAGLMRYSTNYGSAEVLLETDIEYINDYLLLQKMRYNKHLEYHISIPDELRECTIPKLLLQPIVENSLSHGMKGKDRISIEIKAEEKEGRLLLTVRDDGAGMTKTELEALQHSLEAEDENREHIGVYNAHRVVRLLYGENYGLKVYSESNQGTTVEIALPLLTEDEDE